ncbi:MAG: GNAT family N-acetyltransferase [Pseudomonadota bacterium]
MKIQLLAECPDVIPTIAGWLFNEFGYLEPAVTLEIKKKWLGERRNTTGCPTTVLSFEGAVLGGTASLIENDLDSCPHLSPWLADVYVLPSLRKHGHGVHLAQAIAEYAKRSGYRKIYLYTEAQQVFFGRLGWVKLLEMQHHGTSITIMEREL